MDAVIRSETEEREALELLRIRALATIKPYSAMCYPAPSDYDCTNW